MSRLNASYAFAALLLSACTEAPNAPSERESPAAPLFKKGVDARTMVLFASDTTWSESQTVCLNSFNPINCPLGSTVYGYPSGGWGANLVSIPGAFWIWSADITPQTTPAYPAEFSFSKSFRLPKGELEGDIYLAADDYAQVVVNGTVVGEVGSRTDGSLAGPAQSSLTHFAFGPFLVAGENVVTVLGANGNFGCGVGAYSCNTAGVVFGGSIGPAGPKILTLCHGDQAPKGYIITAFTQDPCAFPVPLSSRQRYVKWERYSDEPIGARMLVCFQHKAPDGWTARNLAQEPTGPCVPEPLYAPQIGSQMEITREF